MARKKPETKDLESKRIRADFDLAHYRLTGDSDLAMFDSVIRSGQSAMRAAMALNGAAATAILALVGHLVSQTGTKEGVASRLALVMLVFLAGALAATLAFGVNYLTQSAYLEDRSKAAFRFNRLAVCLIILSYLAFATGGFLVYLRIGDL